MDREQALQYFQENCESNPEFKTYWESLNDEQREIHIQDLLKEVNDKLETLTNHLNSEIRKIVSK